MSKKSPQLIVSRELTPDHIAVYTMPSESERGEERHPVVNLINGDVDCDCKGFCCVKFPLARNEGVRPNIGTPRYHCRHINYAVADCIRQGDIQLQLRKWS